MAETHTSWALLAISALQNLSDQDGAGATGILAGSADIKEIVERGDIADLCIFPINGKPGLCLWRGQVGAYDGTKCSWLNLGVDEVGQYLSRNGEVLHG